MNYRIQKIIIIMSIFFFISLFFLYDRNIDDFAPLHIGVSINLINGVNTPTSAYFFEQIPGYYYLISSVILVTGLNSFSVPYFPILILPYLITSFGLFYVLSNNKLISLLLAFFVISETIRGTHKLFIWPHGVGDVLYFTLLIVIVKIFRSPEKNWYLMLFFPILASIVYISYNVTFYVLLLFPILILVLFYDDIHSIQNYLINKLDIKKKSLILVYIFLLLVIFGLSVFSFNHFVPLLKERSENFDITDPVEKFFTLNFSGQNQILDNIFLQYAHTFPLSIKLFGIIKNLIYMSIIALCFFITYKNRLLIYKKLRGEKILYILLITLAIVSVFYTLTRLIIGQFEFGEFSLVFFISVLILFKISTEKNQKFFYFLLLVMVAINIGTLYEAVDSKYIQKDDYFYLKTSSDWIYTYGNMRIYIPDQLTYGFYFINYCQNLDQSLRLSDPQYLDRQNIINLYSGKNIFTDGIIPINFRANYNAIGGWIHLKSFNVIRDKIETNPSLNKIYNYNNEIAAFEKPL